MSAKPSADVQTSLRWISRCKGTTFFSFMQDIVQKNRHLCPKIQLAILSQS